MTCDESNSEITEKLLHDMHSLFVDLCIPHDLEHFQLTLISPDKKIICLTHETTLLDELIRLGHRKLMCLALPLFYQNKELFWWKDIRTIDAKFANDFDNLTSNILNLENGFFLVRNIDDFYFLYSFATNTAKSISMTQIINKVNIFLNIGDTVYCKLRSKYQQYVNAFQAPIIESFFPFQGGTPKKLHSKIHTPNEKKCNTNIIEIDFLTKS